MRGALLVAGTTSDAGKSVLVAGLCRSLARAGVAVAPFKAQNMSNNSVVTRDGGEIGRAQAMQARAAGIEPSARLNPVLLKPGGDRRAQLVVAGQAVGDVDATWHTQRKASLTDIVTARLAQLRAEYDVVICEGAGSPAEINLRDSDLANMGLGRAANLPVLVVGDIDRGGVFAQLYGTVALLEAEDQALVAGFVINKFRGDEAVLAPGLAKLRALTGRPSYGVLPLSESLWLDAEDSLPAVAGGVVGRPGPPLGADWLRVAVPRLPRISNATDVDALACEPGVAVRFVAEPSGLAEADLIVLPGSKATVADLGWLRATGLAAALLDAAGRGVPVLGVCGGFQMLSRQITDRHESGEGTVAGLGLLDLDIEFSPRKRLGNPTGQALGVPVAGYEIHHGVVQRRGAYLPGLITADGGVEGAWHGCVLGTHWHGLLESDGFRRRFLAWCASAAARDFVPADEVSFAAAREAQLDLLGDLVERHLDTSAIETLIEHGAPGALPLLPPGAA